MRLLRLNTCDEIDLTRDLDDDIPEYAILSHTWAEDNSEEVTFTELQTIEGQQKAGYKKIQFCVEQARKDGLDHCWVDTCCINKNSLSELSEAITSMYDWYRRSKTCYVYLSDVSIDPGSDDSDTHNDPRKRNWKPAFRKSRWFTRGWTLQELLAPKEVVFYSKEGQCLGSKRSLETLIHEITNIPIAALQGQSLDDFSIDERMSWAKDRITKKKEDQAYCLLGLFNVFMYLNYGEGEHALVRLNKKIREVSKVTVSLRIVEGAIHDAYGQSHQACHPDTRVNLLQSVRDWAEDKNGKSVFWLNGLAGTGKSTIAWTVAKWLAGSSPSRPVKLGASFFFKRDAGDRASAALFFPTLAHQLAARIRHLGAILNQVVEAHPDICSKSLDLQFQRLIMEPLQQLPNDATRSTYVVVVVDALDECDNPADIRLLLQLWSTLSNAGETRLRLFLTSRPDSPIRLSFKDRPMTQYEEVVLQRVSPSIVRQDILTFLTHALAEVREQYNLEATEDAFTVDWPGSDRLKELTDIAIPLFIVAATMYRFIRGALDPEEALVTTLRSRQADHMFDVGEMYAVVLRAIAPSGGDVSSAKKIYHDFRYIVGSMVCLVEPLSRTSLAALLDLKPTTIRLQLQSLYALLQIPADETALIQPLHLSFGEYLTSPQVQTQPFGVDAPATHSMLWKQCLRLCSGPGGLQEDICSVRAPGEFRCHIPLNLVHQCLPPALQYACQHWPRHVLESRSVVTDDDGVYEFLQRHFLHWLEAMSLLNRISEVLASLEMLRSQVSSSNGVRLLVFLNDAQQFVRFNRYIIEKAPLQIYSSVVVFSPQSSIIRNICGRVPAYISQPYPPFKTWGRERFKLVGHSNVIEEMMFCPHGVLLASASIDDTIIFMEFEDWPRATNA